VASHEYDLAITALINEVSDT